jgi:hypothetical protein
MIIPKRYWYAPETIMKQIIIIVAAVSASLAGDFGSRDSLHAQVWAGAQISYQKPAGVKGLESGMVDVSLAHWFTDAVSCRLYLRATPSLDAPLVEEATLGYRHGRFAVKAGMLSTHVGRAALYKPFSVFNRFTRTSVVWDSYGFGLDLGGEIGPMRLSGAATLNGRENGAAYLLWSAVDNPTVCERVLVGIQTAELDNQDNSLTVGDDFTLSTRPFGFHAALKYTAYQGAGNPTMKPGRDIQVLGEARMFRASPFTLSAGAFYENYERGYLFVSSPATLLRYSFESALCGLDAQYMANSWLGFHAGYEFQYNAGTASHVPEAGVTFVPVADKTLIRVGWESTIRGVATIHRVTGIVWFEY